MQTGTKYFRGIDQLTLDRSQSVLTIGNFDGVHVGHQEIFRQVQARAKELGGPACVYTFRPHPQEVLRPGVQVKLLNTYDEKLEILQELGLDLIVEEPFSQTFFTLSAPEFFERVVVKGFKARALFVGHDFAFGRNREGNHALLKELCSKHGVELKIIPQFQYKGEGVSSTHIRSILQSGDVKHAAELMGRSFFYRGPVIKGDQRGRLLGFPTANLRPEGKTVLPNGVYATWAFLRKGGQLPQKFASVTNVGVRPTFVSPDGEPPVVVECHLILPEGETIDLYGETLEVRFVDRFRSEKKFGSFDELKTQISKDREQASRFFHLLK